MCVELGRINYFILATVYIYCYNTRNQSCLLNDIKCCVGRTGSLKI